RESVHHEWREGWGVGGKNGKGRDRPVLSVRRSEGVWSCRVSFPGTGNKLVLSRPLRPLFWKGFHARQGPDATLAGENRARHVFGIFGVAVVQGRPRGGGT